MQKGIANKILEEFLKNWKKLLFSLSPPNKSRKGETGTKNRYD